MKVYARTHKHITNTDARARSIVAIAWRALAVLFHSSWETLAVSLQDLEDPCGVFPGWIPVESTE